VFGKLLITEGLIGVSRVLCSQPNCYAKSALPKLPDRTAVVLRLPASLGKRFLQKLAKKFCREGVARRNAQEAKKGGRNFKF